MPSERSKAMQRLLCLAWSLNSCVAKPASWMMQHTVLVTYGSGNTRSGIAFCSSDACRVIFDVQLGSTCQSQGDFAGLQIFVQIHEFINRMDIVLAAAHCHGWKPVSSEPVGI